MKATLTTVLLIVLAMSLYAQEYNKPRNYSAMIITEVKADAGSAQFNDLNNLAFWACEWLSYELHISIPCLSILTETDVKNLILHDRKFVLMSGKIEESNFEAIGDALGVDFLISIEISGSADLVNISGSFYDKNKAKLKVRELSPQIPESQIREELKRWLKNMAANIARQFYCPYQGTFLFSTSTKTEENESEEWTSEDGSYSTSYTKKHTIEISETWDLKVNTTHSPGGNYTGYFLDEYKFDSDIRGRCLKYEDGEWLDIYEGFGNSSEHVEKKDELKISGLGFKGNTYMDTNAYFKLIFDTDSTYKIIVKAISNEALGYRTEYHQMNYSCPCPPTGTINSQTVYKELKTLDQTFGPFPGKPSDKTLIQNIEFKTPVENGTSMVIIRFELKR